MKYIYILALFACVSCSAVNKKVGLPDDNIIEEAAEILIDAETGLKLDLTPSTPEK